MANTHTELYVHAVFSPKNRANLISPEWRDELCKYITGIVQNKQNKMLAINCQPDHIHFLVGFNPDQAISTMIQIVKSNSSKWINERGFVQRQFSWQAGFGAFSYSTSQIDNVIRYINNQDTHHAKKRFKEEYINLLKNHHIEYDARYLFEFF